MAPQLCPPPPPPGTAPAPPPGPASGRSSPTPPLAYATGGALRQCSGWSPRTPPPPSLLQFLTDGVNKLSPEFVQIFGKVTAKSAFQYFRVSRTVHRDWLRLIGRRHDILRWDPDTRQPRNPYTRKISELTGSEQWIVRNLEPFRRSVLKDVALYLPKKDCGEQPYAHLSGYLEPPADAPEAAAAGPSYLKEVPAPEPKIYRNG